jgi:hypothetical protein
VILSLSVVYFLYYLEYRVVGVDACVIHLQSVSTHLIYIVTCWVVHATNMTGSISDDWIY